MSAVTKTMLSMRAAKAYLAGLIAVVAFLAPVVDDGVAWSEALGAIGTFLVAFQGVFWLPNDSEEESGG